jgi:RecB family exonuclease
MSQPEIIFCFEAAWMAELYAQALPHLGERVFSWETLIDLLAGPAPLNAAERTTAFAELLPRETRPVAPRWQATVELLRGAGVLTHEDIDFAGGALSDSPKNVALLNLLHQYVDSPLDSDWAKRVYASLERVKAQPQSGSKMVFVPFERHPLFVETALAFRQATGDSELKETWDLVEEWTEGAPAIRRITPVTFSQTAPTIERLVEHLHRGITRGLPIESICLPFQGSENELLLLALLLSRRKLPYVDLTGLMPSVRAPVNEIEKAIVARRMEEDRPLLERLREAHTLVTTLRTSSPSVLAPPKPIGIPALPESTTAIRIVPLHPLPAGETLHTFYFLSGDIGTAAPSAPLILKEDELGALFIQGIPVPRAEERRMRAQTRHEALLSATDAVRPRFFQVTPQGTWCPPSSRPARAPENYGAKLPNASLSAPSLESYGTCPSRYFLGNRLRLRRAALVADESFFLLLGQLTHAVLERTVAQKLPLTVQTLLGEFEKALPEMAPQVERPLELALREAFRLFSQRVPVLEANIRSLFGAPVSTDVEIPFLVTIDGANIVGKIDRIDRFANGQWVVLDYKTGNVDFTPDHISQGAHFQALLYWIAMEQADPEQRGLGMLFYDLKKGELRRGLLRAEKLPPESVKQVTRGHALTEAALSEVILAGLKAVKTLAAGIARGDFTPTPSVTACERCDFPAFCRKAVGYAT